MKDSKLIVLEGISGAGKSTNIALLQKSRDDVDGVNIKISQLLGNIEKEHRIDYSNPMYYFLLDELKAALLDDSPKQLVLYERYYVSTIAHAYAESVLHGSTIYEGVFRWYRETIGNRLRKPDAYILLDLPVKIAESRIQTRGEPVINKVWIAQKYLELCETYKRNFLCEQEGDVKQFQVDASQTLEEVNAAINTILDTLCGRHTSAQDAGEENETHC